MGPKKSSEVCVKIIKQDFHLYGKAIKLYDKQYYLVCLLKEFRLYLQFASNVTTYHGLCIVLLQK